MSTHKTNILTNTRLRIAGCQRGTWPYPVKAGIYERIRLQLVLGLYKCGAFQMVDDVRDRLGWDPNLPSYSQFGEDVFILDYFGNRQGVYIDVGAFHPWRISNTYLLYQKGWHGVTVEPIRRLIEKHRALRPRDIQMNAAAGDDPGQIEFQELVPAARSTFSSSAADEAIETGHALPFRTYDVQVLTLAEIYRKTILPEPVDLLTIDAEGSGLSVLKGIDFDLMRPRMIVLETNNNSGDAPLRDFLYSHGYKRIRQFGCNEIFCGR